MAIKGLNNVINNLQKVKNAISRDVDIKFISLSLDWISNKANSNLDQRTKGIWGSDSRQWTKKIYKTYGILENQDMNSASIEFGIGGRGANNPHSEADDVGWQYDLPSEYKDDDGRWVFKDARTGQWVGIHTIEILGKKYVVRTFNGYEGKSFLYDAFMEYKQNRIWVTLYQQAFDEVMKGVIKNGRK